ncbi:MAG: patatin-like phospholipase family protein [Planctomycetales bacterium]|nr:patatin-like phospholipase family protein [Planctomycetales bacterium]
MLLEACGLLQQGVIDSLGDQTDCTCDFRVISRSDLLALAAQVEAGFDLWRESLGLIVGTVMAPSAARLQEARSVTEKLFTVHGEQESAAIYLVPPWAKPAAWSEPLALPTHLTIRFVVNPASAPEEDVEPLALFQPLTLALSGGGMRAAIYQLGILVFLFQLKRLKDVKEIVSVSGGSILAGHFLKHWSKAVGRASDFRQVAAEFLEICRSDIRNRIFVPWVWTRLLPWCWFQRSKGCSERLRGEYERIYCATTLGDLLDSGPQLAIVATDVRQHHRVAFTASEILRWSFQEEEKSPPAPIFSQGVELSMAVAASSCFPPTFPRFHLDYNDLGITYREFKQELHLNDGGVVTNLGIEVLIALRNLDWTKGKLILIADAERSLAGKPGDSPLTDVDAALVALGKTAREAAKREFGTSAIPIPFSDRVRNKDGLPVRVETKMFFYRTDLDSPTWQEIHGLMIHGAMVAKQATQDRFEAVSADDLKQTIATIIAEAGGPPNLPLPTEDDFRHCGRRSYTRIVCHAIAAILVVLLLTGLTYGAVKWIWPSPAAVVSQSRETSDDKSLINVEYREDSEGAIPGKVSPLTIPLRTGEQIRVRVKAGVDGYPIVAFLSASEPRKVQILYPTQSHRSKLSRELLLPDKAGGSEYWVPLTQPEKGDGGDTHMALLMVSKQADFDLSQIEQRLLSLGHPPVLDPRTLVVFDGEIHIFQATQGQRSADFSQPQEVKAEMLEQLPSAFGKEFTDIQALVFPQVTKAK